MTAFDTSHRGAQEEQHGRIAGVIAGLHQAHDVSMCRALLEELVGLLDDHFQAEEHSDGFYDSVLRERPEHGGLVRGLHREHKDLLDLARSLATEAQGLAAAKQRFHTRKALLVAALRRHEETESGLLSDD